MSLTQGVSFSLLRFSVATGLPKERINWQYETQDIQVLFDNYGVVTTDRNSLAILTVFQRQTTLERVNIALMALEVEEAVQRAEKTGTPLNSADLPAEFPYSRASRKLAFRYRLNETQIRRVQLTFEADVDFERAFSIFEQHGCRLTPTPSSQGRDGSMRPTSRPRSSRGFRPATTSSTFFDHDEDQRLSDNRVRTSGEGLHSIAQASQAKRPLTSSTWQRPVTPLVPIHEERAFHDDPVMQNIGGFDSRVPREPTRYQTAVSGSTSSAHETSRDHVFARPASMSKLPTISQLENDLRSSIPPPRELPFKKPQSRDGPASRSASSIDLPSLPKPTYANASANEIADGTEKTTPAASRGRSRTARPSTTAKPTVKKPATAASAQKKAAGSKTTVSKSAGGNKARPQTAGRPITPLTSDIDGGGAPTEDVRNALGHIDDAMSLQALAGNSTGKDALAGYAAMSYEERIAVLEKLIIEAAGDEAFITLCEDMSGCWQRIGLGR